MNNINILLLLFGCAIQALCQKNYSNSTELERTQLFTTKTEQRISDLEAYIKVVGDKSRDRSLRIEAINASVNYFIDEDRVFEVSSTRTNKVRSYKIRTYLNNLMVLPYSKVEIEWFRTHWVTKLRKGPDGAYYGVVKIFQKFRGKNTEGETLYEDITEKDIETKIEIIEIDLGGQIKEVIMVHLGDISVTSTRE